MCPHVFSVKPAVLTVQVGVGQVIRGWDQGILGAEGVPAMKVRLLT